MYFNMLWKKIAINKKLHFNKLLYLMLTDVNLMLTVNEWMNEWGSKCIYIFFINKMLSSFNIFIYKLKWFITNISYLLQYIRFNIK